MANKHYVVIYGSYTLIAVYAKDEDDARKKTVDYADKNWPGYRESWEVLSQTAVVYELGEETVYLGSYYD